MFEVQRVVTIKEKVAWQTNSLKCLYETVKVVATFNEAARSLDNFVRNNPSCVYRMVDVVFNNVKSGADTK